MQTSPLLATLLTAFALIAPTTNESFAADLSESLNRLKSVALEGKNNLELAKAWRQISSAKATDLVQVLASLDGADPLAANWLHAAVDVIAGRELKQGGSLPMKQLETFVFETKHNPRARRLAYELIAQTDDSAADRIIPKLLNDPSVEFRRDAVARLMKEADRLFEKGRKKESTPVYQKAINAARDEDQIKILVKRLEELGHKINLPRHFGFLMRWHLIGPFDNVDKKGFPIAYPPEKEIDLQARYIGKKDEVRWSEHTSKDDYGLIDLNKAVGKNMGAVGYAYTEFISKNARPAELRLACKNAFKVWLNGKLLFARDEYHRGKRLDQYTMQASMKPGRNTLLLKICQNEQKDSWAQEWDFQLRVCDATGTAILSANPRAPAAN